MQYSLNARRSEWWEPIDVMLSDHSIHLELCSLLETIADGLPEQPSLDVIARALRIIETAWRPHIELGDRCLFPMLRGRVSCDPRTCDMLDQLEAEHVTDDDLVREVSMALEGLKSPNSGLEPTAIGYLLRAFFESQRRHIAWEAAVIVPLLQSRLEVEDRRKVRTWLAQHRGGLAESREGSKGCKNCGGCACGRIR